MKRQKSEVGSQRSEGRGQRSEIRGQKSEFRGWRVEGFSAEKTFTKIGDRIHYSDAVVIVRTFQRCDDLCRL